MPYGRQLRSDRRRRVLRDNMMRNAPDTVVTKTASRPPRADRGNASTSSPSPVALVGYSQEVRGPCQQRLVHFIPVRPTMLASVIVGIMVSIGCLIGLHYAVWIAGPDAWRSTPLSLLLDVRSRVGLAGWINVQLWLVTAILCSMTYQIRKHRLDDYRAHYRVWLWLAFASLLASIEAGTGLTQVLSASVERFGRLNFGWSGRTLVEISAATAVGMLALRICSELRASPISQILWLMGLICWVPSALLASQLIKSNLRPDYVHWYIGALWLIGKTFIMLASLIYLRQVYIAAQRRFVERSRLSQAAWKLHWPKLNRVPIESDEELPADLPKERKSTRAKRSVEIDNEAEDNQANPTSSRKRLRFPNLRWSAFSNWVGERVTKLRLPKIKLSKTKSLANKEASDQEQSTQSFVGTKPVKATSPLKKLETVSEVGTDTTNKRWRIPRPNLGAIFSFRPWIRLPKLSSLNPLSRMRLNPPTPSEMTDSDRNDTNSRNVSQPNSSRHQGPLPSTTPASRPSTQTNPGRPDQGSPSNQGNRTSHQHLDDEDEEDDDFDNQDRKLSKAERKRLKRLQQEQRRNAA